MGRTILQIRFLVVIFWVLLGFCSGAWGQVTWYVDDDGPGDLGPGDVSVSDPLEDGSVGHPFDAIQEGIGAAVDGDVVMVLDGNYTGVGNRDISFLGKAITLRSENGPAGCIIDCEGKYGEPHRGFYFGRGESNKSIITGFTITNGYQSFGGGIYCQGSSPLIMDCYLTSSWSIYGGGIFIRQGGRPLIRNCVIEDNNGGGISISSAASMLLSNSIIKGNTADEGGGIYLSHSNCTV